MRIVSLVLSIFGLLGICLLCLFVLLPFLLIIARIGYPTADMLAYEYLGRIQHADNEGAVRTGGKYPVCGDVLEQDVRKDIEKFGNSEIRNIRITTSSGSGSDDGIQFTIIDFEYRKMSMSNWHEGKMRLVSDIDEFFRRYNCGNLQYGP